MSVYVKDSKREKELTEDIMFCLPQWESFTCNHIKLLLLVLIIVCLLYINRWSLQDHD